MKIATLYCIGMIVYNRNKGVFADCYYCEPSAYEQPNIDIKIGKPENEFFRLLISPAPTGDEPTDDMAQWVSLPCSREKLDEFADSFNTKIEDMCYYDFQSALPNIVYLLENKPQI